MRYALEVSLFAVLALLGVLGVLAIALWGNWRYIVLDQPLWMLAAALPFVGFTVHAALFGKPATFRFTRASTLRRQFGGIGALLANLPDGLRLAAALLLVVALARPQSSRITDRIDHEGIDIAIALDMSESMESRDMYPDRLEAAKVVIDDFIRRRPRDRIAMVAFGSHASTVAPLTMDHGVLRSLVARLQLGVMDGSRTAIGAGLGVSLNRLSESEAESKIVVLLTDGVHNAGGVDPDSVAQEAADRGVHIYTVLMGRHGGLGGAAIDPQQLERIASATGGYAYTAEDEEALTTSFQDLLDKLERSTIEGEQVRAELFYYLLWPAFFLLLIDIGLRNTRLRRFP